MSQEIVPESLLIDHRPCLIESHANRAKYLPRGLNKMQKPILRHGNSLHTIVPFGRHKTTNPYESQFGYSRAVRRGPFIFVSGTTSIDTANGTVLYPKSAYNQALKIFSEIMLAIQALGGTRNDIMRVRMFVTADEDSGDVGRAMKDALGGVEPAATMIIGAKFVRPEMKVEIEADALVL
ncbi:YjgH family protein [Lyophyllum atratum]|nr:YjgH family protein [Lyophyllum atratum]